MMPAMAFAIAVASVLIAVLGPPFWPRLVTQSTPIPVISPPAASCSFCGIVMRTTHPASRPAARPVTAPYSTQLRWNQENPQVTRPHAIKSATARFTHTTASSNVIMSSPASARPCRAQPANPMPRYIPPPPPPPPGDPRRPRQRGRPQDPPDAPWQPRHLLVDLSLDLLRKCVGLRIHALVLVVRRAQERVHGVLRGLGPGRQQVLDPQLRRGPLGRIVVQQRSEMLGQGGKCPRIIADLQGARDPRQRGKPSPQHVDDRRGLDVGELVCMAQHEDRVRFLTHVDTSMTISGRYPHESRTPRSTNGWGWGNERGAKSGGTPRR